MGDLSRTFPFCCLTPQAFAAEFDAVGVVNNSIQNGVSQGWIPNDIVPAGHRNLAGDEKRALLVAIIDDFEQVTPLVWGEDLRSPVVEDDEIYPLE
jgi:hypothetical protein